MRRLKGWVWGGAVPSPVGGLGACSQKKNNQFCAKNYAILSKFWYFFPILQQKVGDYPPVLKVGWGTSPPVPPAQTPMRTGTIDPTSRPNFKKQNANATGYWRHVFCIRRQVARTAQEDVGRPQTPLYLSAWTELLCCITAVIRVGIG